MNRGFVCVALAIAWLGSASRGGAQVVTYSTGDFLPGEWSSFSQGTGTSLATTPATGGNPGAYRRVSMTVDEFQSVIHDELWTTAVFTPSVSGPVTSVEMSYDVTRVFTSNVNATQVAKGIAVEQDGVIRRFFGGITIVEPPIWDTVSIENVVPLFPTVNWIDGNPITFGFYTTVSTLDEGFTIDGGYDNYRVSVHFTPIPEPSALALLSCALVGAAARRLGVRGQVVRWFMSSLDSSATT